MPKLVVFCGHDWRFKSKELGTLNIGALRVKSLVL